MIHRRHHLPKPSNKAVIGRNSVFRTAVYALTLILLLLAGCSATMPYSADMLIINVRLYAEPEAPPINDASIAIRDGKIVEMGKNISAHSEVVIDGADRVATAGLWNSHVHFTDPALAENASDEIEAMLLRYGFTSVLDTGSDIQTTIGLSESIKEGEFSGPRIFLANGSFVYTNGTPVYLPGIRLPEISDPADAEIMVAEYLDSGAQGIKIFAGSFMSPTRIIHLPPEIIRAVADATHERGGFLVAHTADRISLTNSVYNGVDVLAHTTPMAGPLDDAMIATMLANDIALIPTLKLWDYELSRGGAPEKAIQSVQGSAVKQLSQYFSAGGEILFGTDTGYMRDFDPAEEFILMNQAGMDFDAILASMTTNPARRFADETGVLKVGANADIVIYAEDPAANAKAFSKVQYTIRTGKIVFCADAESISSPCH